MLGLTIDIALKFLVGYLSLLLVYTFLLVILLVYSHYGDISQIEAAVPQSLQACIPYYWKCSAVIMVLALLGSTSLKNEKRKDPSCDMRERVPHPDILTGIVGLQVLILFLASIVDVFFSPGYYDDPDVNADIWTYLHMLGKAASVYVEGLSLKTLLTIVVSILYVTNWL